MPELPEVETIRRQLADQTVGRRITGVFVSGTRTVRRQPVADFTNATAGRTVAAVRRKGKFLLVDLDGAVLVAHLRMSGQLRWTSDASTELMKHTHARIVFGGGAELRFVDPRTFGELWVTSPDVPELAHLGPDALDEIDTPAALAARLQRRKSALKAVVMNQQVVAGIGNIYSDEILFHARLRHDRPPASLSKPAVERLHAAMKDVLRAAVARRGSSLADQQYVDLYGRTGEAQLGHAVYARAGLPCNRCGSPIQRTKVGGRSAFFCRRCQR